MTRYLSILCLLCFGANAALAQTPDAQTTAQEEDETPVQPPWQVCNETSFILKIATVSASEDKPGDTLTVKGWDKLYAGQCQIIDAKKGTSRYVYARSARLHQGGIREWKGRHGFCLSDEDFTAKTDLSCPLQNLSSAQFLRVIPTEERTAFVEPADYGKKAQTAGLQRLLQDNNYSIKKIDGVGGRMTLNTINKFLKDQELDKNLSMEEKFAALEQAAIKTQNAIGVQICNETSAVIWSALAYRDKQGWESRGWWQVDAGACLRPFTNNLKDRDTHFYARLETQNGQDRILKVPGKSGKPFCIGEAKFAAVHHEFCEDQGYVEARFKALPTNKTGTKITLKTNDFSAAVINELRQ